MYLGWVLSPVWGPDSNPKRRCSWWDNYFHPLLDRLQLEVRISRGYRLVQIYVIKLHLLFLFATDLLTWSKKVKRRREWRRKEHRLQRHLPQRRRMKLKQVYLLLNLENKTFFIDQFGITWIFKHLLNVSSQLSCIVGIVYVQRPNCCIGAHLFKVTNARTAQHFSCSVFTTISNK